MKNCVYVLKCRNGRFYVGSARLLCKRLERHQMGLVTATRNLRPLQLVFAQEYPNISLARRSEYWVKRQKDRGFIERIVKEGRITKNFNEVG